MIKQIKFWLYKKRHPDMVDALRLILSYGTSSYDDESKYFYDKYIKGKI